MDQRQLKLQNALNPCKLTVYCHILGMVPYFLEGVCNFNPNTSKYHRILHGIILVPHGYALLPVIGR